MSERPRADAPLADATVRRWGAVVASLRFFERVALPLTTMAIVASGRGRALAASAALAMLFALRAIATGVARTRAQRRVHEVAIDAVLRGDPMHATTLPHDDAQGAVFEGIHYGSQLLAETMPELAGDAAASAVLAVLLAVVLPARLVVAGFVALVAAAGALTVARRATSRIVDHAQRGYAPIVEAIVASLGARLELVAGGRDDAFRAAFAVEAARWQRTSARVEALAAFAGRVPAVAAAVAIAVGIVALGGTGALGDSDASLLAHAATFASVVPAFLGVARGAHALVKSRARLAPFYELLARRMPPPASGVAPPSLPTTIRWEDVTYIYPEAPEPAVRARTITWRGGEILVLAGSNGAGKSTLIRLLLGLASPSSGRIVIGDTDLRTVDMRAWRRRISFLPQRPYLPERGTIRDAMHLLAPKADDARVEAALAKVEILAKLRRAGDPLATRIASLSVGERQRVALARALVQDASILLLDEPDANLDAAGIALVARIVRELARDRMVAVAAHTPTIVDVADHLVSLDTR